jgi:hypothetical protein
MNAEETAVRAYYAIGEAARILRPGGLLFAAAISRWVVRIDGIIGARIYRKDAVVLDLIDEAERTGFLPPLYAGGFTAYMHRPADLRAELTAADLEVNDLVSVEGPALILPDLDDRLADPVDRAAILDGARALESVPELVGFGPHLLATAVRSATG